MKSFQSNIPADIETINKISVVPVILEVMCRTTGMGFATVARVTDEEWVACAVRDEIKFGLMPGGKLKLDTTICNEIRQSGKEVIIDNVIEDEVYHDHHTMVMYGLQSYISLPIVLRNDYFFGTLCAIDTKPALLNTPEIVGLFKAYAGLISFYLDAAGSYTQEAMNRIENKVSAELNEQLEQVIKYGPDTKNITSRDAKFIHVLNESMVKVNHLIDQLKVAAIAN